MTQVCLSDGRTVTVRCATVNIEDARASIKLEDGAEIDMPQSEFLDLLLVEAHGDPDESRQKDAQLLADAVAGIIDENVRRAK